MYPGSSHHSDILYRTKDASDNHIDFTCHQRRKWPGWRLENKSQPFLLFVFLLPLYEISFSMLVEIWKSVVLLARHKECGPLHKLILASSSLCVTCVDFRNDRARERSSYLINFVLWVCCEKNMSCKQSVPFSKYLTLLVT